MNTRARISRLVLATATSLSLLTVAPANNAVAAEANNQSVERVSIPHDTESEYRLWADTSDEFDQFDDDGFPRIPDEMPGSTGVGAVFSFASSSSAQQFMTQTGSFSDASVLVQGNTVTVRAADDSELARLQSLASSLGTVSVTREFMLNNYTILGSAPSSNDEFQNDTVHSSLDLVDMWADFDASGADSDVVVAVLDTGLYAPSRDIPMDRLATDVDGNFLQYNAFTGDEGDGVTFDAVKDGHGHGTFIAAQIVGEMGNSIGSFGICESRCRVMPVKVLDDYGSGDSESVAAGIRWAVDHGADVINLSLGSVAPIDALDDPEWAARLAANKEAVEYAAAHNVAVFAAAGNHNASWHPVPDSEASWPAAFPSVMAVAAADPIDGSRLSFSAWGESLDGVEVAAPGCVAADMDPVQFPGKSGSWCGTSMATPMVAAMAAMLRAVFPELSPTEVLDRITAYATPNDYTMYGNVSGTNLLDRGDSRPVPAPPAARPLVSYDWDVTGECVEGWRYKLYFTFTNNSAVDSLTFEVATLRERENEDFYREGEEPLSRFHRHPQVHVAPGETQTFDIEVLRDRRARLKYGLNGELSSNRIVEMGIPSDCEVFDAQVWPIFACYKGKVFADAAVDLVGSANVHVDVTRYQSPGTSKLVWNFSQRDDVIIGAERMVMTRFGKFSDIEKYFEADWTDKTIAPGEYIKWSVQWWRHTTIKPEWYWWSNHELAAEVFSGETETDYVDAPDVCSFSEQDGIWYTLDGHNAHTYEFPNVGTRLPDDYTTLNPIVTLPGARLLDTRSGLGMHTPKSASNETALGAQQTVFVDVAGRGDVPEDAQSAMLSVTAVNARAEGFLTVWPCTTANDPRPDSSVVNYNTGWTRANGVMTAIGPTGGVCVFSHAPTDVIVDVQAYSASEQVVTITPKRTTDTRRPDDTIFSAGETRRYDMTGHVAEGASAIYINMTSVGNSTGGFATAWPCNSTSDPMPDASILNHIPGAAVANNSLVGLSNGGFCVFSYEPAHIIIDLMGYLTTENELLEPITPYRFIDTRSNTLAYPHTSWSGECPGMCLASPGTFFGGESRMFHIAGASPAPGRDPLPDNIIGVVANFTATNMTDDSFMTVFPCRSKYDRPPDTSMLNYNTNWAAASNNTVQMLSDTGALCVYSHGATDVIIDISAVLHAPNALQS